MSEPRDLLRALKASLIRRCNECDEPVDSDGNWTGECYLGSGRKCDACFGCACDESC